MNAFAQNVPGSADPGRIIDDQREDLKPRDTRPPLIIPEETKTEAPDGAGQISFTLKEVNIVGASIFTNDVFESLYVDKIDKTLPATEIWALAAKITDLYKQDGYFLSRAFVPAQKIDEGIIRIDVIEGHIAEVDIEGRNKNDKLIQKIANNIVAQKPAKIKNLESNLLRLGDLYGISYNAVLDKKPNMESGSVVLILKPRETVDHEIQLETNNYGSKFVGPHRVSMSYDASFFDYNKTTLTGLAALPGGNELALASLNHNIQITPSLEMDFLLSKTKSRPGFTLKQSDIESNSFSWGMGFKWMPIRQRSRNFEIFARLDSLNSNTNTFGEALTRDKIRVFRTGLNYDQLDRFSGYNSFNLTLSRGISAFGASLKGDNNLSRSDADPNFTKLQASYARQQYLTNNVFLTFNLAAQLSSRSLFSSEEFGYGGINIGRAYDFSEITGDHGLSALLEFQYTGFKEVKGYKINPFLFYDIGKVWNKGSSTIDQISASSAGFGARVYGDSGLNIDATLAFPLTKSIDTPLYGNSKNPILRFGINKTFDVKYPSTFLKRKITPDIKPKEADQVFEKTVKK